jgi:hypothetical protein
MRQLLQITLEVDMERGDDALSAARDLMTDDWSNMRKLNEQPVHIRAAHTMQAHAR